MSKQRLSTASHFARLLAACALGAGMAVSAADAQSPGNDTTKPAPPSSVNTPPAKDVDVVETPGVVVKGRRNPLSESDRRLKEVQKSLPDLNSDGKRKKSVTERAVDRVHKYTSEHSDPNKLDDSSKAFLQQTQNPLDREHQGAPGAPPSRDPQD